MKPLSLVNCDVANFCQNVPAPLVMRTVEEAPTEDKPVPPLPTANVPNHEGVNICVSPLEVMVKSRFVSLEVAKVWVAPV